MARAGRACATVGRPRFRAMVIASLMAVLLPAMGGQATVWAELHGLIQPRGWIEAEGQTAVPASQAMALAWQAMPPPEGAPILEAAMVEVRTDEWVWESPSPSAGGAVPPWADNRHWVYGLADAQVRNGREASPSGFAFTAPPGAARLDLAGSTECRLAPIARSAESPADLAAGAPPLPALAPATLHVLCKATDLTVTTSGPGAHLVVHDGVLHVDGVDARGHVASTLVVVPGLFISPRSTSTGVLIYEYTVRTVTIGLAGTDDDPAMIRTPHAHDVRLRTPTLQWQGRMELPPFFGSLSWRDQVRADPSQGITLEGVFLLVAQSPTPGTAAVEIVGAAPQPAAASSTAHAGGHDAGAWLAAAAAGIALVALGKALGSPAIGMFSRIQRAVVLRQKVRRMLDEHVRENPGVTLVEASRNLGFHRSTVLYHAKKLLDHGLLTIDRHGNRIHLFPPGGTGGPERMRALLLDQPVVQRLLDILRDGQTRSQQDVAQAVGRSQQEVSRLVRRLEAAGVIRRERRAGGTAYKVLVRAGPS